jgi:hypothetical protein
VVLGKISVQSCQVAAQRLGGIGCGRHQLGMNSAPAAGICPDAHPAQRRIMKSCLGPLRPGMNPGRPSGCAPCVKRREGFAQIRPGCRNLRTSS